MACRPDAFPPPATRSTSHGTASYSQSGGLRNSTISVDRFNQSGGTIGDAVTTDTYELAGGTGVGFENVTFGSTPVQSGGVFDRDGVVVPIFTQSGGLFSGSVSAQTYNLTGAGATSTGGAISASDTSTSRRPAARRRSMRCSRAAAASRTTPWREGSGPRTPPTATLPKQKNLSVN